MTSKDGREVRRRRFLAHLGVGGAATALGVGVLPEPPASPAPEPTYGAVTPDTEHITEDATPYAVWQYRRDRDGFTPTAPVNVVFPLDRASFDDVVAVFEEAGWHTFPEEYARYAWDRAREEYVLQQYTAAETRFGKVGRHHVRCWELDGTASIQAHIDSPAVPQHTIDSYASGQHGVEILFEQAGWEIEQDALTFANDRQPDHDGRVTVIRREELE